MVFRLFAKIYYAFKSSKNVPNVSLALFNVLHGIKKQQVIARVKQKPEYFNKAPENNICPICCYMHAIFIHLTKKHKKQREFIFWLEDKCNEYKPKGRRRSDFKSQLLEMLQNESQLVAGYCKQTKITDTFHNKEIINIVANLKKLITEISEAKQDYKIMLVN